MLETIKDSFTILKRSQKLVVFDVLVDVERTGEGIPVPADAMVTNPVDEGRCHYFTENLKPVNTRNPRDHQKNRERFVWTWKRETEDWNPCLFKTISSGLWSAAPSIRRASQTASVSTPGITKTLPGLTGPAEGRGKTRTTEWHGSFTMGIARKIWNMRNYNKTLRNIRFKHMMFQVKNTLKIFQKS